MKHLLAPALLLSASICPAATPADATKIIGGSVTSRHPAVAVVLRGNGGGYEFACSATLVGPRWLLTTGACAAQAAIVAFGPDIVGNVDDLEVFDVVDAVVHPASSGLDNDVALLRIDGTPSARPIVLDLRPIVAGDVGLRGTMVGFGTDNYGEEDHVGVKREAVAVITLIEPSHLIAVKASPNACYGDGGGPFLVGGRMMGMVQFTGADCAEFTGFHRVDTVAGFLLENAPLCTVADPCLRIFAANFEE